VTTPLQQAALSGPGQSTERVTPLGNRCLQAAIKLHEYLMARQWTGDALIGPDPGIRLNYRVGRFVKSYLDRLPWNDDVYFLQTQGYWVLANWSLFKATHESKYREIAVRCSARIAAEQRGDGTWKYPLRPWAARVATVEGIWATLGLLATYRHTGADGCLRTAVRWHRFLTDHIGYQRIDGDGLAINYFAGHDDHAVPNNSTDALRFLAEMAQATGDKTYLQPCAGLIRFLQRAQEPTGEFPYIFRKDPQSTGRTHFQCYQYNAFQCLGLMSYFELTGDRAVLPLVTRSLTFLSGGLARDGHAHYMCGNSCRTITYHAAVLGAAFTRARTLGFDEYEDNAESAYGYVLRLQQPDGRLPHSRHDYCVLTDHRSYPRYLAMIVHFLSTV
jgi:uncharacterized protein YyaL (SSP411 family)